MSESDFYTVNHGYEAQGAPREWPTWELTAHGSAAPAPRPTAPDEATASDGRGCPAPQLDPLGSWCSARLTFADGALIEVLVTVSDDHITVEDVRADPPLRLDGLADLARWIEGPLDDAFRTVTGRPRRSRPAPPRGPGPAAASPERAGGPMAAAGTGCEAGAGREAGMVHGTAREAATEATTGPARGPTTAGSAHGPVDGMTPEAAEEPRAAPGTEPPREPMPEPAPSEEAAPAGDTPAQTETETEAGAGEEAGADSAPATSEATAARGAATGREGARDAAGEGVAERAEERARSALLARSRVAERRKLAAEVYRRAQREGRDPVLAVMLATGRNRRRSLRLIAGARDDGLLTPRHNKR
ncbi:DUF6214 family protein [Streptomyces sp. NPDC001339]|uniref:DUF6214 family protein n=1 Tax=Streptomyces sp. NPDC001339 TaxID=3364563 RepID=UPI00368EB199